MIELVNRSVTWRGVFEPCAGTVWNCPCGGERWGFVEEYLAVLRHYKPKVVYEWGAGMSTGLALGFGAYVYTVESDKQYIRFEERVEGLYECFHITTESSLYTRPLCTADLYFVDARHRAECIMQAAEATAASKTRHAVLCLHDAQRPRYHDALRSWPHVRFLSKGFAVAAFRIVPDLLGTDEAEGDDGE